MCLGVPGRVTEVYSQDELPMARVSFGGIIKEICLSYTPEAQVGDYVLVHVGFALSRIDEAEAQQIFADLQAIAEAGDCPDFRASGTPLPNDGGRENGTVPFGARQAGEDP